MSAAGWMLSFIDRISPIHDSATSLGNDIIINVKVHLESHKDGNVSVRGGILVKYTTINTSLAHPSPADQSDSTLEHPVVDKVRLCERLQCIMKARNQDQVHALNHGISYSAQPQPLSSSSLLLPRRSRLGRLFLITSNHHHTQKGPNDSGTQQYQDHRYTDRPDAGREEVVERVTGVDEWLHWC